MDATFLQTGSCTVNNVGPFFNSNCSESSNSSPRHQPPEALSLGLKWVSSPEWADDPCFQSTNSTTSSKDLTKSNDEVMRPDPLLEDDIDPLLPWPDDIPDSALHDYVNRQVLCSTVRRSIRLSRQWWIPSGWRTDFLDWIYNDEFHDVGNRSALEIYLEEKFSLVFQDVHIIMYHDAYDRAVVFEHRGRFYSHSLQSKELFIYPVHYETVYDLLRSWKAAEAEAELVQPTGSDDMCIALVNVQDQIQDIYMDEIYYRWGKDYLLDRLKIPPNFVDQFFLDARDYIVSKIFLVGRFRFQDTCSDPVFVGNRARNTSSVLARVTLDKRLALIQRLLVECFPSHSR
ncbi:hypothetical protein C8J56DRAFT_952349 [Mycena floridula]|nr:hypothetical protein C8J56DRAFT_952349 [Mycena floridula]